MHYITTTKNFFPVTDLSPKGSKSESEAGKCSSGGESAVQSRFLLQTTQCFNFQETGGMRELWSQPVRFAYHRMHFFEGARPIAAGCRRERNEPPVWEKKKALWVIHLINSRLFGIWLRRKIASVSLFCERMSWIYLAPRCCFSVEGAVLRVRKRRRDPATDGWMAAQRRRGRRGTNEWMKWTKNEMKWNSAVPFSLSHPVRGTTTSQPIIPSFLSQKYTRRIPSYSDPFLAVSSLHLLLGLRLLTFHKSPPLPSAPFNHFSFLVFCHQFGWRYGQHNAIWTLLPAFLLGRGTDIWDHDCLIQGRRAERERERSTSP